MMRSQGLKVLFVASEADPFIKVGGLGDVAGSLPLALHRIQSPSDPATPMVDVRLVIPFHPAIRKDLSPLHQVAEFAVTSRSEYILAKAFATEIHGLPVYLLAGSPIDQETGVYSANLEADGYKYVFFSLAVLELAKFLSWQPDILHANDWHTAAAVYSLALQRSTGGFFNNTASLLTVHNLPYLGSMTAPGLEAFGLPPAETSGLPGWAQQLALPLGIYAADAIVAVSPGYATEILTDEFGSGLDGFLRSHAEKVYGILNGLDMHKWDPALDRSITANFSSIDLSARPTNKSSLQADVGLKLDPDTPLLAMVTRMDPQKGVDLAVAAIRQLLESASQKDHILQAIFLGTGDPALENAVRMLEQEFPSQVRARIEYNEALSRRIYAGADMLLMPSLYEPCGLSQMIAMRYGCIPIARATGGLSDTIHDPANTGQSTGFLFKLVSPEALASAIRRAILTYSQNRPDWQQMQIRGMQQDFSWDRSAQEYLNRYTSLIR